MPTYVYRFVDTGETIEVQQSFDDPTLTETNHPVTGATMPVKKVFQPVGVTFRGTGFYKTDSRGGKSSTSTSTDGGKSDGGKSDGAKTDSPKSDSPKSDSSSSTSSTPASTKSASSSD